MYKGNEDNLPLCLFIKSIHKHTKHASIIDASRQKKEGNHHRSWFKTMPHFSAFSIAEYDAAVEEIFLYSAMNRSVIYYRTLRTIDLGF